MRLAVIAAAFVLGLASAASADQITIGNSPPYLIDIAGTGSGNPLAVSSSPWSATALFDADLGTANFGSLTFSTGHVNGSGIFPIIAGGLQSLNITFADGDHLLGTIHWTEIDDGSLNPHLAGSLNFTASGDAAFLASFPASGTAEIDAIFATVPMSLENWCTDQFIQISTMEIVGLTHGVFEPSSLLLLGVGGLFMLGLRRMRLDELIAFVQLPKIPPVPASELWREDDILEMDNGYGGVCRIKAKDFNFVVGSSISSKDGERLVVFRTGTYETALIAWLPPAPRN